MVSTAATHGLVFVSDLSPADVRVRARVRRIFPWVNAHFTADDTTTSIEEQYSGSVSGVIRSRPTAEQRTKVRTYHSFFLTSFISALSASSRVAS